MTDTVKKLRSLALKLYHLGDGKLVNDASDVMGVAAIEIEKLRAEIARLRPTEMSPAEKMQILDDLRAQETRRRAALEGKP